MLTEIDNFSQSFTSDNTLNAVGNYRIISFDPIIGGLAFISYTDSVTVPGGSPGLSVFRSFRWSTNGSTYSMWVTFDPAVPTELLSLNLGSELWIEFKFQLETTMNPCDAGTPISPPASIESVSFSMKRDQSQLYPPNQRPNGACGCSSENCVSSPLTLNTNFTFNPYAINQGLNLYQDLSRMVNLTFGHEVQYVRVAASQQGRDVFLGEYTVFGDPVGSCIKVLVPNNEFPDSKPSFNQYGVDFEVPFEVHIDRAYWEDSAGKNIMPQQFDVMYFPIMNRIYEVQSTYMFRDFMYQPLYYKMALVKYQDRANRDMGGFKETLDNMVLTPEALFGDEKIQETIRITKPMQYQTITEDNDPIRYSVNRSLSIERYDLYNNWVLLTQNYYDLNTLYNAQSIVDAVVYKPTFTLPAGGNLSYCFWFAGKSSSTVYRNLINGRNQANVGIDIGVNMNLTGADTVVVTHDYATETFTLPEKLTADKWFALVVNVSQEFSQIGITLWTMQSGKTAELRMVYEETKIVNVSADATDYNYRIKASPLLLTNVRIFNDLIPTEKQSGVMGQMNVRDSNKLIVADNAKPILRLAKVVDPK
jgi:hypothetical protein